MNQNHFEPRRLQIITTFILSCDQYYYLPYLGSW